MLTAIDADVIKTYVELGSGHRHHRGMAYDPKRDRGLRAIDAGHLFAAEHHAHRHPQNAYLRGYTYDFIEMFAPSLTRKVLDNAMAHA